MIITLEIIVVKVTSQLRSGIFVDCYSSVLETRYLNKIKLYPLKV